MASRILVIDDDRNFRALVKLWLEQQGHSVVEADNGKEATQAMAQKPDLVIVDGLLPDTDGFRWIQGRRDLHDETPMVFLSFFYKDMESFRKLTGPLGVKRVLQKTLSQKEFMEAIEAVLEGRSPPPVTRLARGSSTVGTAQSGLPSTLETRPKPSRS